MNLDMIKSSTVQQISAYWRAALAGSSAHSVVAEGKPDLAFISRTFSQPHVNVG